MLQVVFLHLLDNNKVRTGNFSGGCSPYWVNHVCTCLYCFVYLSCFISSFVFILLLYVPLFLTIGIRAKGNLQENRVPSLSGSNGGRWKV
jgi:hypothetical protein